MDADQSPDRNPAPEPSPHPEPATTARTAAAPDAAQLQLLDPFDAATAPQAATDRRRGPGARPTDRRRSDDWRIDESTKTIGRQGIEQARAALRSARRRHPDLDAGGDGGQGRATAA